VIFVPFCGCYQKVLGWKYLSSQTPSAYSDVRPAIRRQDNYCAQDRRAVPLAPGINIPTRYKLLGMDKIKIEQHSFNGIVWLAAWLFTIGYLRLTFWKGVLAIVLWPYYLGVMFSTTPR
jgi:hypothetical protein